MIQRYQIFCWFLIQDRLNTTSLLLRKSFHLPSYQCALCNEQIETTLHLFLDCSFALECWHLITPNKKRNTSFIQEIMLALNELPNGVAMNIVIMSCWHIWMQRNGSIFQQIEPSVESWRLLLKKDLNLLTHKIKARYVLPPSENTCHQNG